MASTRSQERAENYEAFELMLPDLLEKAAGRYALLRDRRLVELFESAGAAHRAGSERFGDGLFSVQKVKPAVSSGFFSYARYCG
jgi:hypothetical protein